ncbi:MAG: formylglycine-generating enzyme family protein [Piscirickettsiaceae bacterium]|nr:formylglycine-generating enzyme family protein [Piscirickettsiaceae bacterium]
MKHLPLCFCLLFTFTASYAVEEETQIEAYSGKMITIPAGSFQMGSNNGEDDEKPVHLVSIKSFKMSQAEITFKQWDACVDAGGCSHQPKDEDWGRDNRPVINVSYNDITQQYISWLNKVTGANFRLPTEAEWEYAARAGSDTKYSWGDRISCGKAQYDGGERPNCFYKASGTYRGTAPVAVFKANAFGLNDMHGNVWEWTQDCWSNSYSGAPSDGSAWTHAQCERRVLRGGSSYDEPEFLRSAYRLWDYGSTRGNTYGFRLVLDN